MAERKPLVVVDGTIHELPVGDTVTVTAFTPTGVQASAPVTVPESFQWVVYTNPLVLEDDLLLEGDLVMLL
jgi:hypothetical protein